VEQLEVCRGTAPHEGYFLFATGALSKPIVLQCLLHEVVSVQHGEEVFGIGVNLGLYEFIDRSELETCSFVYQ